MKIFDKIVSHRILHYLETGPVTVWRGASTKRFAIIAANDGFHVEWVFSF